MFLFNNKKKRELNVCETPRDTRINFISAGKKTRTSRYALQSSNLIRSSIHWSLLFIYFLFYVKFTEDGDLNIYNTDPVLNKDTTQRDFRRHGPCQVCNIEVFFLFIKKYRRMNLYLNWVFEILKHWIHFFLTNPEASQIAFFTYLFYLLWCGGYKVIFIYILK